MKEVELYFNEKHNVVVDADTNRAVFNVGDINHEVIRNVVLLHNFGGNIDSYLLIEGKCTQEEREHIVEAIYLYENK